jgi:hypothetical protein
MPCEIGNGFHNLCSWAYGGKGTFLESSLWTSIIVVGIILLLILSIYPCKKGTSTWVLTKLIVYSFFSTLFVLSVHKGVVLKNVDKSNEDQQHSEMIESMGSPGVIANEVEVKPDVHLGGAPDASAEVDALLAKYDP